MHEVKKKLPFNRKKTSGRTRKGGRLSQPAGGLEDRKEGKTNTITFLFKGYLLRERNTS